MDQPNQVPDDEDPNRYFLRSDDPQWLKLASGALEDNTAMTVADAQVLSRQRGEALPEGTPPPSPQPSPPATPTPEDEEPDFSTLFDEGEETQPLPMSAQAPPVTVAPTPRGSSEEEIASSSQLELPTAPPLPTQIPAVVPPLLPTSDGGTEGPPLVTTRLPVEPRGAEEVAVETATRPTRPEPLPSSLRELLRREPNPAPERSVLVGPSPAYRPYASEPGGEPSHDPDTAMPPAVQVEWGQWTTMMENRLTEMLIQHRIDQEMEMSSIVANSISGLQSTVVRLQNTIEDVNRQENEARATEPADRYMREPPVQERPVANQDESLRLNAPRVGVPETSTNREHSVVLHAPPRREVMSRGPLEAEGSVRSEALDPMPTQRPTVHVQISRQELNEGRVAGTRGPSSQAGPRDYQDLRDVSNDEAGDDQRPPRNDVDDDEDTRSERLLPTSGRRPRNPERGEQARRTMDIERDYDDDHRSDTGYGWETEYFHIFQQTTAEILAVLASSPEIYTVEEVLNAKSDNRGEHWNTRSFWTTDVFKQWARKVNKLRSEKSVNVHLQKLERVSFPIKLKDHSEVVQGEAWEDFRGGFITTLRDCFRAGCAWENMMQRLLNASKDKARGNKRVESMVRKALSDSTLYKDDPQDGGGYSLLGADVFLWQLDESYATVNHGPQAATNAWARCTEFEDGETFDTLGKRVQSTYAKFIDKEEDVVHHEDHHRMVLFNRIGDCLKNHKVPDLGKMAYAFWDDGVRACLADLRRGELKKTEMTVDYIMRKYVTSERTKMEAFVNIASTKRETVRHLPLRTELQPRRTGRAQREIEVNAVTEEHDESDQSGGAQAAIVSTRTSDYRNTPPPTSYTSVTDREKEWGRECEAPKGNKGHPQGREWTEIEWKRSRIDLSKLDALASNPRYQNLMCKIVPLSKAMEACRLGIPRRENGKWGPEACAFCAFRPINLTPRWRSGSAETKGSHPPATCRISKRFLAEGGDREHASMSRLLQGCLTLSRPEGRNNDRK